MHVQATGPGHTVVYVQKARWASEYHGKTLKLKWVAGEGFEVEGDRDYLAAVREYLSETPWRTKKEIATAIESGEKSVLNVLTDNPESFEMRTGDDAKALGRSEKAQVWGLRSAQNAVNAVTPDSASPGSQGGVGSKATASLRSPLRNAVASTPTQTPADDPLDANDTGLRRSPTQSSQFDFDSDAEMERIADKFGCNQDGEEMAF